MFSSVGEFVEFPVEEINQSIPDRFEKIVAAHPGRLAVKTNQAELTYAELNRQANRVAHTLLARHGGMEEPILLLLDNGAPMIASIIGVLKAGKIYVPLDPSFPLLRHRQTLEDTAAGLIVTDNNNQSLAVELAAGKLALVNIDELDRSAADDNPRPRAGPDAPAYILYTSGSTGRPKGVLQNHRNVLHLIMRHTNRARVGSGDRITLLRSFGVHGGTYDTFAALLNGAAILPFDIKRQGLRAAGQMVGARANHAVPHWADAVSLSDPGSRRRGSIPPPSDACFFRRAAPCKRHRTVPALFFSRLHLGQFVRRDRGVELLRANHRPKDPNRRRRCPLRHCGARHEDLSTRR